jgi:hypothetical protein
MNKELLLPLIILGLIILGLAGAGALFYHLHCRSRPPGTLYHVLTEFEFTVQAPYKVAAPLFGPEGERAWASDDWNPNFLYPQPARDIEGAVFQVSHGHHHATWVNTAFDLEQGHIQYVYFLPDVMVTRIDLHLTQPSAETTSVHVAYERTALNAAANQQVREFGDADRTSGPQWSSDIARSLAAHRE